MNIYKVRWNFWSNGGNQSILSCTSPASLFNVDKYKNFESEDKAADFQMKLTLAAKELQCEFYLRTSITEEYVELDETN